MIFTSAFAATLLALLVLSASITANESGCVSSYDESRDYFPDKVQVKYGAGFDITYKGNAKYIRNSISGENYVLYQCGTPAPANVKATPADSLQVGNWTKIAAVPGTKIVLDSAPASAIIEMLGVQDAVGASYKFFKVTSPCMQKKLDSLPKVQQNFGTSKARKRNNALVRRVSYDISDSDLQWTFTTYGMNDPHSFAVNPENASDMLGKAEWIKFVAAFFNKEAEANKIFDEIETRYKSIQKKASTETRKTVGFARYNKVANGTIISWTIEQPQPWVVQGLADANMKAHNSNTAAFSNVDDFYKATEQWDVLIDLSIEPLSHGGTTIPLWQNLLQGYGFSNQAKDGLPKFLSLKSIYRSDLISSYQNATDYNEHLQIQADQLLEDFGKIASTNSGTTDTVWYRNMPLQVPVNWRSPSNCQS
ncbi:hypothetical protein IWW36_005692 [Coemansia brasiliensis]|uniref:Uncharacterized protein n=1 Tax=Coemansia brasiliensis TaxID=2650707 RepID=A0A9W8I373_9FUNG|nr:hypothetical protein IWW36_005692 [Coemansia brasiliensis]